MTPAPDLLPVDMEPPAHLDEYGRRVWAALFSTLRSAGRLTVLDVGSFSVLCTTLGRVAEADAKRSNADLPADERQIWAQIWAEELPLALELKREFGLDPADDSSPLAAIFGGSAPN